MAVGNSQINNQHCEIYVEPKALAILGVQHLVIFFFLPQYNQVNKSHFSFTTDLLHLHFIFIA